ncbi:hypothetical protein ABEF95_002136 [Exophiala dermatitidis]
MSGYATNALAMAVTQSGGLGFIGFPGTPRRLELELEQFHTAMRHKAIAPTAKDVLPVGVGVICLGSLVDEWRQVLSAYKPAVIWLSFANVAEFASWTTGIREASPHTKVWIQLGSVSAALEVAQACRPDALVLQGSDAGGHGHANGASLITLVPEVADTLRDHDLGDLPLVAAGGIMDGRSGAAALSLGASGLVMGTRFLSAVETVLDSDIRQVIFEATDGGAATARSRLWDDIWGPNPWPSLYDGRCMTNAIYEDARQGLSISEVRKRLYERNRLASAGQVNIKDVATIWAGTGVGLVKRLEKAADIVKQMQTDTKRRLIELSQAI